MTRTKQIKMLDELAASVGSNLKLVIYDYWKNEIAYNGTPHRCSLKYPLTQRYHYSTCIIFKDNDEYNKRYCENIYKKLTIAELVELWKDPSSDLAQRYKTSSEFREMYDMLNNSNAYCIEINVPESEQLFIDDYMSKHPEYSSYEEALEKHRQFNERKSKNFRQYANMMEKIIELNRLFR